MFFSGQIILSNILWFPCGLCQNKFCSEVLSCNFKFFTSLVHRCYLNYWFSSLCFMKKHQALSPKNISWEFIYFISLNISALVQPMINQTEINGFSLRHKYFFKTHCHSFSLLGNFETSSSVIWPGMRRFFWNMMILAVGYTHTDLCCIQKNFKAMW